MSTDEYINTIHIAFDQTIESCETIRPHTAERDLDYSSACIHAWEEMKPF